MDNKKALLRLLLLLSLVFQIGCDGSKDVKNNRAHLLKPLNELLLHTPEGERGGFVIFESSKDLGFIQFSLDEKGLIFNWPTFQEGGENKLDQVSHTLARHGFIDKSPKSPEDVNRMIIFSLKTKEMVIADDGLYAQSGRNASDAADLTVILLREVLGVSNLLDIKVTLHLDG